MNLFDFIAKVIESLAWPITIIVIFVVFRESISKIFLTLSNFKYKDISIDFKRELSELESMAEKAEITKNSIDKVDGHDKKELIKHRYRSREEEIEQVALISPTAAIPLAWTMVEDSLMSTIMRLAISPDYPPNNSALLNIQYLRDYGGLDDETFKALNRMRQIRNEAVHGKYSNSNISTEEALEYSQLAINMVKKLESITRERNINN